MKYLAVLGRQPKISLAELESLFTNVRILSPELAVFESEKEPGIDFLGGCLKIATLLEKTPLDFLNQLPEGKITLGISDYSEKASARKTGAEALKFKKILARHGRSARVIPNKTAILSTATAFHNSLGLKQNHIELIKLDKDWYVSCGVQNIDAYSKRDQARPARDAKVGMLPPKLAQILINLCGDLPAGSRVLDPFCGTGVVLQEATLMGYKPYGTDIDERMIKYSRKNLEWLGKTVKSSFEGDPQLRRGPFAPWDADSDEARDDGPEERPEKETFTVLPGDATNFVWDQSIDAVACETYLGQPMSNPPAEIKLKEEKQKCGSIILGFLKNLSAQIKSGTPVTIAVPAWLRPDDSYSRLNLLDEIEKLGYNVKRFKTASQNDLLYHREGQIVAREIIVLRKK